MLYTTLALFAIAAMIGLVILKNWLTASDTSKTVVYSHGLVAAISLLVLLLYALQHPAQSLATSVVLFVIAAVGGFYMFQKDMRGKNAPMWMAYTHALLAVTGFVFLLLVAL